MKKLNLTIVFAFILGYLSYGQNRGLKIENNKITIPIGNKVTIRTEVVNDNLTNFNLLEQSNIDSPIDMMKTLDSFEKDSIISNELEFKFCYADFMGSKLVVLTTLQHLGKPLKFKAKIKIRGHKKFFNTSIETKYSNVFSIEQWKDDIDTIILYDFEIIEEKN